jgi:superoxide reductase
MQRKEGKAMTKRMEIYKCDICGNIVEVMHAGAGELVCCGKPMRLCVANTVDAAKEKHVPVIEKAASGVKVSVGSIPHPMEAKHYIEWIELQSNGRILRQFLKPGDAPLALFETVKAGDLAAFEYCNLHGLWKSS